MDVIAPGWRQGLERRLPEAVGACFSNPAARLRARVAGLLIAVALGIFGQLLVAPPSGRGLGWLVLALASGAGLFGMRAIDRERPLPAPETEVAAPAEWRWRSVRAAAAIGLGLLGGLAVSAGVYAHATTNAQRLAVWSWVLGLALIAAAVDVGTWTPARVATRRPSLGTVVEATALVAILGLALALRVVSLDTIPPQVDEDEALWGLGARAILRGPTQDVFSLAEFFFPRLSFALYAPVMALFGDNLFGYRMGSVIQGLLSILVLYALVRQLFGPRPALMSAFLLAVGVFHVHYSRVGVVFIQGMLGTVFVLYLVVRAVQTRRALDFLLAGYAVGFCAGVYYAARLAPVIAGVWLMRQALLDREFVRRNASGLALLALGAMLFAAPLAATYAKLPQGFSARSNDVLIFKRENMDTAKSRLKVDSVDEVLIAQARATLGMFSVGGDTSRQFRHFGPLADTVTAALFVLGLSVATARFSEPRYFLFAAWAWLTLIVGSALTIEPPFTPRLVAMTGPLAVLPALVLDASWRGLAGALGRRGAAIGTALVVLLLGFVLHANYMDYFTVQVTTYQQPDRWVLLSRFIESINSRYRVFYVGDRPESSLTYQTARFLLPDLDGGDAPNLLIPLRREQIPPDKGAAFLVEAGVVDHDQRLQALRTAYPGGREEEHYMWSGLRHFTSYLVEREALVAQAPR